MYYKFIFSFYSKLISVINGYGLDWENTFVYFCTEILIITSSTSYNILQQFCDFVIINLPLLLTSYLHNYVTVSVRQCLKSNDSKFYNVNRKTSKVGNFLELCCSATNIYFST